MNRCKNCGKETKNAKFCSHRCSAIVNNRGVRRHGKPSGICLNCGAKTRNAKFCSSECDGCFKYKAYAKEYELTYKY